MPLGSIQTGLHILSLCTDSSALLLGLFLFKDIEELSFSVVEISQ